jgi:hypothetical protein
LFGCLIKCLLFLVLLPVVMTLPPLAYFFLMWMAFTDYFRRRDERTNRRKDR